MTVLVTGGASGIGASLTRLLTSRGIPVVVIDREPAGDPGWHGGLDGCAWHRLDLSRSAELERLVDRIGAEHPLTGIAACAGLTERAPLLDFAVDDWNHLMSVNVLATAVAARSAARTMIARGAEGSIVTIASTAGVGSVAGLGAAYHASKGAIVALTAQMAGELGPHGIRANAVVPGLVRTPMSASQRAALGEDRLGGRLPAGRLAEPEEVASAIAFLLSPASAQVTGQVLPVEGGQLALALPPESFPVERSTRPVAAYGVGA